MGFIRSDESAQIIVVAALLLAVVFVVLAIVLNSAIYAENMATRGETTTGDAMATDSVTAERLGNAIDAENYGTEEASYPDRRARLADNVSSWNDLVGAREAQTGNAYSVDLAGVSNGTRVNQSDPTRDFQPADSSVLSADPLGLDGDMNWQTAADSDVRDFRMTIRRDSLYTADDGLLSSVYDLLAMSLDGSIVFWTQFEDGDSIHRMYLLNDTDNASVAAVVTEIDGGSEDLVGTCTAKAPDSSDYVTVRITDSELEGDDVTSDCPALEAVDGGNQDLYYAGSDEVRGTYRFLADRPEAEFRDALHDVYSSLLGLVLSDGDLYATNPTDEDPYTTTALYDATVETTYNDGRITYTRNVTYPPTAR